MRHTRHRKFNTGDTYSNQGLDNDLCQAVKAGNTIYMRGQVGTDFDGMGSAPTGLEDVSQIPNLLVELARRGYTDEQLAGIAGENVLRVMERAEEVAVQLRKARVASEADLEEKG